MIPLGVLAAAGGSSAGSSDLWTPANLSAPFWLGDSRPIVTNVGETNVEGWGDPGNGLNVLQSDGSYKPGLTLAGLNGKRYVGFDGTNDVMIRVSSSAAQDLFRNRSNAWMFGVHRKRLTDVGTQNRQIFLGYDSGSSTRFGVRAGSGSGGANKLQLVVKRLDGEGATSLVATTAISGSWYMWLAIMDWSTGGAQIWINGELDNSAPSVTSAGNTSNTAAVGSGSIPLTVGNNAGRTASADVDLAELVCNVDQVLTTDDIDKLFGYAAHYYGLTSELDVSHPYKSVAPTGPPPTPPTPAVQTLWVGAQS